ncbi:4Fe-4S dicluster domain-containing protein [Brevibacillus sp. SYSU BS000544]|uniref:4Fe-4S dicluster domain-containing protein n=1 Tax=Brevibacillus sp. SYSU BS000544 TaxID=3416443 RepID=UPI003CE58E78
MAKKAFVVNIDRCIGCHACEISCKSFYQLEPDMSRRTVRELPELLTGSPTRAYLSSACNHCDDPACKKACPVGAYTKREDGIVVHDPSLCIGCKMCAKACPYKVPQFNNTTKKMDKCSMCYQLQDEGKQPICVSKCPMDALEVIDLEKENRANLEVSVAGFANTAITHPTTRFILPKTGKQVRRDV